ncbi:MAG: FAD-dependent oxidoreductase [Microbacterium sp.]
MNAIQHASVVIIGGGQAGVQFADSLRTAVKVPITIVTDEIHHPYQRPPLSKSLWKSDVRTSAIPLRNEDFFRSRGIRLLAGVRATAIDRDAKRVTLDDGESIPYSVLVLATGARPRTIPLEGSHLPGVHQLRTIDDGVLLQDSLRGAKELVVLGGGFIGLEVAASAAERGMTTTVLEMQANVLQRALTPVTSRWLTEFHIRSGVDIRLQTSAEAILASDGRASAVVTGTGERIPADLIVLGVGAVPNSELAAEAGLTVNDGIIVDANLQTDDPAIWAIGDSVRFPSHFTGATARLESVQNATDQARVLAKNVAASLGHGEQQYYAAVPWFWSNQGPVRLQIAGIGNTAVAETVVRRYGEDKLSVFAFEDGRLTVVESINAAADHIAARRIIASGGKLDKTLAEDPTVPLASAVAPQAAAAR